MDGSDGPRLMSFGCGREVRLDFILVGHLRKMEDLPSFNIHWGFTKRKDGCTTIKKRNDLDYL